MTEQAEAVEMLQEMVEKYREHVGEDPYRVIIGVSFPVESDEVGGVQIWRSHLIGNDRGHVMGQEDYIKALEQEIELYVGLLRRANLERV